MCLLFLRIQFQCEHSHAYENRLFHIFGDKFGSTDQDMRQRLVNFMADEIQDVKERAQFVFRAKKRQWDSYLDGLSMDRVLPDEVALFYLCKMFGIHVKVLLKRGGTWSTSSSVREYTFVLAYIGDNVWKNTMQGAFKPPRPESSRRSFRVNKPYKKMTGLPFLLCDPEKAKTQSSIKRKRSTQTSSGTLETTAYDYGSRRRRPRVIKCTVCGEKFASHRQLTVHSKAQHGNMHACSVCDRFLSSKEALKRHMLTHDPEQKKFICSACGKRFGFESSLKSHMKVHSNVKPYVCPSRLCDKRFKSKGELDKHKRAKHSGEDWIKCPKCDLTFETQKLLKMHADKHAPPKRQCPFCEMKFHWHTQVRAHIRYYHKNNK